MFAVAWRLKVDPNGIGHRFGPAIDIDRALTRAAEEACGKISKNLFGESDPTFMLVVGHGARTFVDSLPAVEPAAANKNHSRSTREYILVHVLLLPPVGGERKAVSADEQAWLAKWDQEEVCQQVRGFFSWSLDGHKDENLQTLPGIEKNWKALITEACAKTVEDLRQNGELPDFKPSVDRVIARFRDQFRTMTKDMVWRRHTHWRAQAAAFVNEFRQFGREAVVRETASNFEVVERRFRENVDRQRGLVEEALASFRVEQTHYVQFCDLPSNKALLLGPSTRPVLQPNRSLAIGRLFEELRATRLAFRILTLGELALLEMKVTPMLDKAGNPPWIGILVEIAEMGVLPHQEILDAAGQYSARDV
jgi:hypothetical protein